MATLRPGDSGAAVKTLQERLSKIGLDSTPFDGYFGPRTLAALIQFQTNVGLKPDGVCGPATMKALTASETSSKVIWGLDTSHWNKPEPAWAKLRAGGAVFVFNKASQGIKFVDNTFKARRIAAKKAGLIFGAYHYFNAYDDPIKQADHFLRTTGGIQSGEMAMFDWETVDGTAAATHKTRAKKWLDKIEAETGRIPIIYTGSSFANDFLKLPAEWARYPLWVAHYGVTQPRVPRPWRMWNFWQYTDRGNGANWTGDTNWFQGTIVQLQALGVTG